MKRGQIERQDAALHPVTLGEIADKGLDVFCWCNRCTHSAVLPTARLLKELGPAYPVPEVGARLVCSSCGSRDVATRPDWPNLWAAPREAG
ncbi:MAG: hypothetical protein H6907_17030 [Hyphomicrobiales bacterium]|nr:hypothetical protein [Hyphomicrobiales bacterium]MCP5373434.1 hypothetical protein [Hyphomicrobiales bacterium]